jgi:hypothetical protein
MGPDVPRFGPEADYQHTSLTESRHAGRRGSVEDGTLSESPSDSCAAGPIGARETAGRHRGGNRQLNAALYRIAIVQARHHPPARAYLARKIAEDKTPREARRALKRHLANVIYRRLYTWAETTPALNT